MEKNQTHFTFQHYEIVKSLIEIERNKDISSDLSVSLKKNSNKYDDRGIIELELNVKINDRNQAIKIDVDVIGIFKFDKEVDPKTLSSLVNVNASAMLFPYVRSYITSLTALSGIQPVILPVLNLSV